MTFPPPGHDRGRFEEATMTSSGLAAAGHSDPQGRPGLLQPAPSR